MANLINEAEIRETWSPIIESATGINDASKLAWMSEYCHNLLKHLVQVLL